MYLAHCVIIYTHVSESRQWHQIVLVIIVFFITYLLGVSEAISCKDILGEAVRIIVLNPDP